MFNPGYIHEELNSTSEHSFHRFRADAIFFRHAWRIREAYELGGVDRLNSSRTILVVMKNDRGDESTAITGLWPTRGNGWELRDLFTRRDDSSGGIHRWVIFHLVGLFVRSIDLMILVKLFIKRSKSKQSWNFEKRNILQYWNRRF